MGRVEDDPLRYKKNALECLFKKRKRSESSTDLRVLGLPLSVVWSFKDSTGGRFCRMGRCWVGVRKHVEGLSLDSWKTDGVLHTDERGCNGEQVFKGR